MIDRRPELCENCFNEIVPGTMTCVQCGGELRRLQSWRIRRSWFGSLLCGIGVFIQLAAFEHLSLVTGWLLVAGLWLARFGYRIHVKATTP
jgi:hypothetical protein